MIPVLGIALYNRRDLLQRCLDSVDFPVKRLIVVNNGNESLHELKVPDAIQMWDEKVGQGNIGCAGGWNYLQNAAFHIHRQDYLLLCGNDVAWAPGDLQRMHQTVVDFPEADYVFGNHSFSNFIIKKSGFQKCRWFDENFIYGYYEDSDMWQRVIREKALAIHAAGLFAHHEGSATIKSDRKLEHSMKDIFRQNATYYAKKWGCPVGSAGQETFATPFNQGGGLHDWAITHDTRHYPHFRISS